MSGGSRIVLPETYASRKTDVHMPAVDCNASHTLENVTVEMKVNGVSTKFEVDTGADASLMSTKSWNRHFKQPLEEANIKLSTYSGAKLLAEGMAHI